jgi:predicted nucleotide-binding protein
VSRKRVGSQDRPELKISHSEAEDLVASQLAAGQNVPNVSINHDDEARQWYEYTAELLRQIFTTDDLHDEFTGKGGLHFGDVDITTGAYLKKLRSIHQRLRLFPSVASADRQPRQSISTGSAEKNKVFLVHGHDEAARDSAARLLERLGLQVVILHEQPSASRTVIEKLEAHGDVDFALVLLTADDVGKAAAGDSDLRPRARQNVILELGYFFGRLGRRRVCALHKGNVELPSDYLGIVYVDMDPLGSWHLSVARELRAAGFSVDMNKIL